MDSAIYMQLLERPEWRAFRKRVLERRGRECENCGVSEGLEIHHRVYVRGRRPWEYDIDEVEVLCSGCHEEYHRRMGVLMLGGYAGEVPAGEECARCKGEGYYSESVRILGGRCLRCLGWCREDAVHLSLGSVWALSLSVWDELVEGGDTKFVDERAVFDWIAGIHGFTKEDREGYLAGQGRRSR